MWWFDESRHLLRRDGETHRLEPKAVAVLSRLVATPGAVVTKEELLESAWPGQYVSDEVLTNSVYQIRRALGDEARRPRFIETIPKSGYRLLEAPRVPRRPPGRGARTEVTRPAAKLPPIGAPSEPRPWPGARRSAATLLATLTLTTVGALLTGGPPEPPRVAADELVERGWAVLESSRPGAPDEAAALAREAIGLEPENADAWALSATAATERAGAASFPAATRGWTTALEAASTALEIAPRHPRALAARARARWLGSWDWEGAESDLLTALAIAPDSAPVLADYAELLFFSGRVAEARRNLDRALELDPVSARIRLTAGLSASLNGDARTAARHYREVLDRHPGHEDATRMLTKLGRPQRIRRTGEKLEDLTGKGSIRPGHVALWFLESEDDTAALTWLDRAIAERDSTVLFFRFDSRWDRLRDHPRYRAAMTRAGISARS